VSFVLGWQCVTQLHDVVYIVANTCCSSALLWRFHTPTHQQLTMITLPVRSATDIAACERTSQLYIAFNVYRHAKKGRTSTEVSEHRVCRVSEDSADIQDWLTQPMTYNIHTLSVTSARLLLTTRWQLLQLDAEGNEIRRVCLPEDVDSHHATESPNGTFIVFHRIRQADGKSGLPESQWQVSEVNTESQVLRHFTSSRLLPIGCGEHMAVDSQGNVLVIDDNCILLLDARLALRRVIIDEQQLNLGDEEPYGLWYVEQLGRLFVKFGITMRRIAVFDMLRHVYSTDL